MRSVVLQVDESPNTGKVSLGLSVIVRVTLKDGAYHEVCTSNPIQANSFVDTGLTAKPISGCRIRAH